MDITTKNAHDSIDNETYRMINTFLKKGKTVHEISDFLEIDISIINSISIQS